MMVSRQLSPPPASLRQSQGLIHKLKDKFFKTDSAGELSNSVTPVVSSNGQDPPRIQTNQVCVIFY